MIVINYVDIDITDKKQIQVGMLVDIRVQEEIKRGIIKKILSKQSTEKPLKVELTNGLIGRLVGVPSKIDLEKENFKFYNLFLNNSIICALYDRRTNQCYMSNIETSNGKKTVIYLFGNANEAKQMLKGSKFDNKNYYIRPIKRDYYIPYAYPSDFYIINLKKKISAKNLEGMERKFYLK